LVADLRSVKEYIFPVHEPRVLLPASPISFMGSILRTRSDSRRVERVAIIGERNVFSQKMNDHMICSRRASLGTSEPIQPMGVNAAKRAAKN